MTIQQQVSSQGAGVGSNPAAALVLIAFLAIFRFGGQKAQEAMMNKKRERSKAKATDAEKVKGAKLALITAHFFETVWAVGASVAAAMVISTSTHRAGRRSALLLRVGCAESCT